MRLLSLLLILALGAGLPDAIAQERVSGKSRPGKLFIVDAEKDQAPPSIRILSPQQTRGIGIRRRQKALTIEGLVEDNTAVRSFQMNGNDIELNPAGAFSLSQPLRRGVNRFVLQAEDAAGNVSVDSIVVERDLSIEVTGEYHALVVGIDEYTGQWPPLENAVHDAVAVAEILEAEYAFDNVRLLTNEQATRRNIISEIEWFANNLGEEDHLLIYYSGHGQLVDQFNRGYWVPVDASGETIAEYIPNTDIQTWISGIPSKHTLLIADACFAGDVFRSGRAEMREFREEIGYYEDVLGDLSRKALTSGGIEPVLDGGKDGHSVFTYYLLKALRENEAEFYDASQLYEDLRIPVVNNSEQTPQFNAIRNAGDEGGQFVFIK